MQRATVQSGNSPREVRDNTLPPPELDPVTVTVLPPVLVDWAVALAVAVAEEPLAVALTHAEAAFAGEWPAAATLTIAIHRKISGFI